MIKILWISDLSETGYANASRIFINYLLEKQEKYDISYFAINHFYNYDRILEICESILPKLNKSNFYTIDNKNFEINKISHILFQEDINVRNIHMEQRLGFFDLEKVLLKCKPDIVISINDNGVLEKHCKIIDFVNNKYSLEIKKICYLPIDCYNLPKGFFDKICCDEMWALNKFGRDEIMKTEYKIPIKILPHSIDTKSFFKLENKEILRTKWLPENFREKFIILNTNKNQIRKRLDITLKTFAELYKKYPGKIALILKTGLKPSLNDGGIDLVLEIKKLGEEIEKNIFIIEKSLTLSELNELYNLVDININTSIGEGWGIIPCEVALCGIAQLVPNNTSYPEIFPNECLVDTDFKLRLERDGEIKIIPKGLQCICKGYRVYIDIENKISYHINLNPSHIDSFLLSEEGDDLNPKVNGELLNGIKVSYRFKTWEALVSLLIEKKPLFFQIFSENGNMLNTFIKNMLQINYDKLISLYKIESIVVDDTKLLSILIKEPKIDSFVNKISNFIENPNQLIKLGELCRKIILENYSIDNVGNKLEELIDNFIDRKIKNFKPDSQEKKLEELERRLELLEKIVISGR